MKKNEIKKIIENWFIKKKKKINIEKNLLNEGIIKNIINLIYKKIK